MNMLRLTVLCAAFLALVGFSANHPEGMPPLFRAIEEAHGGPEALEKLRKWRSEAEVVAVEKNSTGSIVRDFQAPDMLRVEISFPEGEEVRLLDGTVAWMGNSGRVSRATGAARAAMRYQMIRMNAPLFLLDNHELVDDMGTTTKGGDPLRYLRMKWSDELDMVFGLDPETSLVKEVIGRIRAGKAVIPFKTSYGDYRAVSGVNIPHTEKNFANGRHTGDTSITSITFNPLNIGPFDPKKF